MEKSRTNDTNKANNELAIHNDNYVLLLIGFAIIVIGFILMAGGGSDDPNVFKADELFSFRRITLSTILIIFGFGFEVYAIMRRPVAKNKNQASE